MTLDELFTRCIPEPNTGCWLWAGARKSNGYGQMGLAGKDVMPHRLAAKLAGMTIEGLLVCHKCDTRACCNPAHLFVGTHSDNIIDAYRKGRRVQPNSLKTACPKGHPLSGPNLYVCRRGLRSCRECANARTRAARGLKRAARLQRAT